MFENAYRFYGPMHSFTKHGLRLEFVLEQKLLLLPKNLRDNCTLEATSERALEEVKDHRTKTAKININGSNFFSHILYRVRGCRAARERESKKRRSEAGKQARLDKEMEVVRWDENMLSEKENSGIKHMWELPSIGLFLCL